MNKTILIKYLKGQADQQELEAIAEWLDRSPENKKYFARLKLLWDISGEVADEHPRRKQSPERKKFWLRTGYFSAAAAVAVLLAVNIFLMTGGRQGTGTVQGQTASAPEDVTVYTHKGVVSKVMLPDSSIVWLNADTRLTYPPVFNGDIRRVSLSGEAFFEVARDTLHPMVVSTGRGIDIEVLGTSFLVRSYSDDTESEVALFEGAVAYHYMNAGDGRREVIRMSPNESVVFADGDTAPRLRYRDDIYREIAWMDGNLVFDSTPMPEVFRTLERWYGVEFSVVNEAVWGYSLTSTFYSEPLSSVVELMEYCMPFEFSLENGRVTVR